MQLQLHEQDSGCQDESRSKQIIIRILFLNIMSNTKKIYGNKNSYFNIISNFTAIGGLSGRVIIYP